MAQQSSVIFAALAIAFIVFIVTKGELPKYIGILKGNAPPQNSNSSTSTMSNTNSVEQQAAELLSQSGIQIPYLSPLSQ